MLDHRQLHQRLAGDADPFPQEIDVLVQFSLVYQFHQYQASRLHSKIGTENAMCGQSEETGEWRISGCFSRTDVTEQSLPEGEVRRVLPRSLLQHRQREGGTR